MTIYCSQCGKPNAAGVAKCAACGVELRTPSDAPKRYKGTMILGNPIGVPGTSNRPSAPSPAAQKTMFGVPLTPGADESPAPVSQRPQRANRTIIGGPGFVPPVPQGLFSDAPNKPDAAAASHANAGVFVASSPPSGTVRIGSAEAHETFSAMQSARPIAASVRAPQATAAKYFGSIGIWSAVVGVLSFIPIYGIPFALLALVWGWITRRQGGATLALIGTLGFLVGTSVAAWFGMQVLQPWLGNS